MEGQNFAEDYQQKTDDELLRLELDADQLTTEAGRALRDELARRKIDTQQLKASRAAERNGTRRSKHQRRKRPLRFSKSDIGWLVFTFVIGFLVFRFDIRRHGPSFQHPATPETSAVGGLVVAVITTLWIKLRDQ